jgi:LacI family transcriptional regulator
VVHDEEDGIRRILAHLVSCGHRRIAAIAGPQELSTGYRRYRRSKRSASCSASADQPNAIFAGAFNECDGERCAEELIARGQPFSAVVCANDRLAVGAIAALRRHGLSARRRLGHRLQRHAARRRLLPALTTVGFSITRADWKAPS